LKSGERPTNEQVRNFLQLRDGDARQSENLATRRVERNFGPRDGDAKLNSSVRDRLRQLNLGGDNSRVESQAEGDRAWAKRFGKAGDDRGDRSLRLDENGRRGGDSIRRFGDANRHVEGRVGGERDFGDRRFVDSKYQQWRDNAWRGERGDARDHRDQSGRWNRGDRFVAAHRIRDHWKGHKDFDDVPFRGGWWNARHHDHDDHHHLHHNHRWHWHHWDHWAHHHHRPFYWWSWSTAPRLTTWFTFGWQTPYYWDYGLGEYIYCYDDVIYVNGVWFQPAPVYYEQTLVLAQRAPDWTAEQAAEVEWLPLGVFVVARDGVADMNVLVQLAVTKEGVIGGTVFNQTTGATFPIEGTVDKQTQRAVWTYVDEANTNIVMETSIYNLTQPEATGLIHHGPDNIQVVELVRLEEPSAATAAPAQPALIQPAVAP
jgi:hypothetical protein